MSQPSQIAPIVNHVNILMLWYCSKQYRKKALLPFRTQGKQEAAATRAREELGGPCLPMLSILFQYRWR